MRYAIAILLLAGCSTPSVEPIDFVPAISVAVGVAEVSKGATPDDTPAPSGECDNCGGTGKVGDGTVFVPCGACGGDGKIEDIETTQAPTRIVVDAKPVIECTQTPLVEKLLPTSEPPKPAIADGQLSPRGQWRWSQAQWAWVPVRKPGPAWVQNGHSATIDHLVREHGYSRSSLASLTQAQLDVLHSNAHNAARAAAPVRSSGCPGGVCPSPSRGGLFRRR